MIRETSADDYTALLTGHAPPGLSLPDTPIAPPDVLKMLADVAARVRSVFAPVSWLIMDDREIVGLCTVTRPPDRGVIDIGYGIAPSRQRRGFAGRAIGDIVAWARLTPGVRALTADTGPDNVASQCVLARNGFSRIGERIDDEDGRLICWRIACD